MIICTHNKDNEIPSPLIPFNSIPGGRGGGTPTMTIIIFPPPKKVQEKQICLTFLKNQYRKHFPIPSLIFFLVAQLAVYGQYFVPKTSSSCLHS